MAYMFGFLVGWLLVGKEVGVFLLLLLVLLLFTVVRIVIVGFCGLDLTGDDGITD